MLSRNDLEKIDSLVQKLSKEKDKWQSLAIAVDLADEIMKGILPNNPEWQEQLNRNVIETGNLPDPLPVNTFSTQKQTTWFNEHPTASSARIALRHFYAKDCALESKFYWFSESVTKQKISASTEFSKNWEDSELTRKPDYKVGIDFFLTNDAKSLLMVISNRSKLRVLELSEKLSNTQKHLFENNLSDAAAFTGIFGGVQQEFEPQRTIHTTLWNALQLKEVNKKFFNVIATSFDELVNKLVNEGGKDHENAKQFSSRLLGRLLFTWFLRKMDIVNENEEYFNTNGLTSTEYYEQQLKLLFFKTLNTPINKRKHRDTITPYLNGGLFEPKENDYITEYLEFPEDYFFKIYEHFDGFNFTTDESSADYELIAVDPEMLGQVFESLLASQIRGNGTNERRETGSYYTPREVVEFMCRETLRRYLYNEINVPQFNQGIDELLDLSDSQFLAKKSTSQVDLWGVSSEKVIPKIKSALDSFTVLDPACGSGAYPMGMLQLLLKTYERIEKRFDPYKLKLSIIENSIFGVDIQPMAVEISRLRAWLSVLVDENDKNNIQPLPNLDFKFVCANTLISLDKGTSKFADPKLDKKLANLRDMYFNARSPEKKKKYQDEYHELTKINLFDSADRRTQQLKTFDPFKNIYSAEFFDAEYMFGISGGFDAVIGNPPYLLEGKTNKQAFKGIPYYQGKMDLWYSFAAIGIDFLKKNGHLCFIAKNNWVTNSGASVLRNKIITDAKVEQLIDFGNLMIFENADQQTMIMLFKKNKISDNYTFDFRRVIGSTNELNLGDAIEVLDRVSLKASYLTPKINRLEYKNHFLTFSKSDDILTKIQSNSIFLDSKEIAQGIVFPQDVLNKKNQKNLGNKFTVGQGIFVLTNEEKESLQLSDKELELIRPYYTTEQVDRYYTNPQNTKWLIYTDSSFKDASSMDGYPNLKAHLDQFNSILTSTYKPYGLHRARKKDFFVGEKVVAVRKSVGRPIFSYSNFECCVSQTFNVIKTNKCSSLFLVGLLNSSLIAFWLKNKGKMQGDNFQLDAEPIMQIPIKISENQNVISALTQEVIKMKKDGKDTSLVENQIDSLVYDLYGISEDERNVIRVFLMGK